MDYEKKYKEALEVMKDLYNVVRYQSSTDALYASQNIEKAFPELKMSALREILGYYGMPEENIELAIEQIAETYGSQRYLVGVADGVKAVEDLGDSSLAEELMDYTEWLNERGFFAEDLCVDFEHQVETYLKKGEGQ